MLLLDEPTNDLDVETLGALEEAIENFAGCAVVISHDRFFLDRLATHILAFEGDSHVEWFEGNFEAYEEDKIRRLGEEADPAAPDDVPEADALGAQLRTASRTVARTSSRMSRSICSLTSPSAQLRRLLLLLDGCLQRVDLGPGLVAAGTRRPDFLGAAVAGAEEGELGLRLDQPADGLGRTRAWSPAGRRSPARRCRRPAS